MKTTKYTKVSINIILVFLIVMLASLIPGTYPEFFGDWFCKGSGVRRADYSYPLCDYGVGANQFHLPVWHWGYRHWIWMVMGISLFIVQCIRIGYIIDKEEK